MRSVTRLRLLLGVCCITAATADVGDDFSNNLFSDLAPLLALFGERITMQFMSQSMGWADHIILAMAPLGIITAIVSAIRVSGPPWLRAIIGRARENRSVVESELMSSTSNEVCELWNGHEIVRVMGQGPIREFIILLPDKDYHDKKSASAHDIHKNHATTTAEAMGKMDRPQNIGHNGVKVQFMELGAAKDHIKPYQPTLRERIMGRLTEHHHDEEKAQLDFTQVIPDCKETQKNYYRLDEIHEGSYVTVVRNTAADTPNLTLNIRNQVGRADLYVVAVCGIILQLGSLLYFWFATYYPSLRFPKDGDRVAQYAFPCAAAGTLLLVTGILICSHTVEDSTLEKSYRPMPGKQARVVWIQRSSTVNEQEFQSFAVFPSESQALIKTSHRTQRYPANKLVYGKRRRQKALNHLTDLVLNVLVANSMKEIMVVIGVLISLCGYIVQFVGFRGLHWSASVVQLGVIAVMAVLRVWVRRNLAIIPRSQPLLSDHEMDWLALTLGGDYTKAPWLDTSKASGDKSSTLWAQSGSCIWEIQGVEYAENLKKLEQHKLSGPREAETSAPTVEERQNINGHQTLYLSQNNQISESWSNPHICMRVRRDIGRLADWHGPASAEAISLARAIEFTMDALLPSLTGTFTWSINTSSGPIHFQIKREPTGTWKSLSDELEAALSLWLYALYDKEQGYQAKNKYEKELPIAFERTDQQREEKLNQKTRPHEHEKSDDDSWLRAKGMHAKRSVRLLGPYTQRLCQDLRWWMPDAGVNIFEVRQQESADSDIYEVEPHRIVGIVPKIGSNITQSTGGPYARLYRAQKSSNSLDISYLSDPVTQEGTLAIESHSHLKGILAQHLFSAFMWAVAKKLTRPVPGGAQIHSTKASSLEGFSGLPLCSLRNTRITQMAHSIESTGLGELEMIYACIIAPLSMENKLPRTDSIVAWTRQAASPYEQGGDWEAAIYAYLSLFKVSEAFPKYDPIFIRATALLMENLRAIATTANIKKLQHVEDYQKSYQEDEIIKALKPYDDILGNIMGLYERQGRSWNCDIIVTVKPLREKNDMLKFTELHNKLFTSPRSFTRQRSDVGKEDILGWRPLHYAVARGSDMSIRKFLSMKTDINARDIRGQTPLHYAYRHDDVIARTLLGAGAEVEAQDFDGLAPLHCAAIHGNVPVMQALLEVGANIDILDYSGFTPLLWAAFHGQAQAVEFLWEDSNTKLRDRYGKTPFHLAAIAAVEEPMRRVETIKVLIRLTSKDDVTKTSREILDVKDRLGRTPLHLSVKNGDTAVVEALANFGSDINAKDGNGRTPLLNAIYEEQDAVVKTLVQAGADLHLPDGQKQETALHLAAASSESLVRVLLEGGADVNATIGGMTLLHFCAIGGQDALLRTLFIEFGLDINARNTSNMTPLHEAVIHMKTDVVKTLLELGADKNIISKFGRTPLQEAESLGWDSIRDLLK